MMQSWLSLVGSVLELWGVSILGWEWWKALQQAEASADRHLDSVPSAPDLKTGRSSMRDDPVQEAMRDSLDKQHTAAGVEQDHIRADNSRRRYWYTIGVVPIALGIVVQGVGSALSIVWAN